MGGSRNLRLLPWWLCHREPPAGKPPRASTWRCRVYAPSTGLSIYNLYSYFDGRGSFRYTRLKIPPRVRSGILEQVMGRAVAICDCSLGRTSRPRTAACGVLIVLLFIFTDLNCAVIYSSLDGRGSFRYTRLKRKAALVGRFLLEQVMGVEPTSKAWEAFILPMNYTCIFGLCLRSARTVTDFAGVA